MTADDGFNPAFISCRCAVNKGNIKPLYAVFLELVGKGLMSLVIFCDNQYAGSLLVYPVNNAGPQHAADSGQVCDMGEEGIYQSAAACAGPRMNHHAGSLVYHHKVLIFKKYVQRYFFWDRFHRCRRGDPDKELFPSYQFQ